MNTNIARTLVLISIVVATPAADAQSYRARPTARLPEDILGLKRLAEAGDPRAQIALGNKLLTIQHHADALAWFRKAATNGFTDAHYRMGVMLLHGAGNPGTDQGVPANPAAGVRALYCAATNFHPHACRDLSAAFQRGCGVEKNYVEAYAWLQLFADADPATGRPELDKLALKMSAGDIQAAQKRAKEFKRRHWPTLVVNHPAKAPLKLDGVTSGGNLPLAIINRRTLAAGETALVPVNDRLLAVKCLAIREASVLVEVEGEMEPRWLAFEPNLAVSPVSP